MSEGKSAATPTEDAFEAAWREYNANGNAGGWERVAFISGFGKGFKLGSVAAPKAGEPPLEAAIRAAIRIGRKVRQSEEFPREEAVQIIMEELRGAGETPAERPKVTTFRCDCGLKLLVEGQVIAREFLPPGAGSTKEGK